MSPPRPEQVGTEAGRWLLLIVAGGVLTFPYFTGRHLGAGDSLWYVNSMADAVAQAHAGVFPVLAGQSDFAFNGSNYPLRSAPYYQYLGLLLDALTFRQLTPFALQHATAIVSVLGGLVSCYLCLARLLPAARGVAALLAVLYAACPGVAGLTFAQDLYMSCMAQPWVPLAVYGAVRSLTDPGARPVALTSIGLAALWWAHAPIALWTTALCAALQLLRIRTLTPVAIAVGVGSFAVLAAFPFVSNLTTHAWGESVVPFIMDRERVVAGIRDAFPANLLPVGRGPAALHELQLGWSLLGVLALGLAWSGWRERRLPVLALAGAGIALLVLLFPWPGLNPWIWRHLPETAMGITFYWPAQRLIIIAAAVAATLFALAFGPRLAADPGARRVVLVGLAAAAAWSLAEAARLGTRYLRVAADPGVTARLLQPENVAIMRQPYAFFARIPSYFTHGVMDPAMEGRLLDPAGAAVLATNFDAAAAAPWTGDLVGRPDANPGILLLEPELRLEPGRRHLLVFDFAHPGTTGVLQFVGPTLFREYSLPTAENATGFGAGPGRRPSLTLWTSNPAGESIRIRFIPDGAAGPVSSFRQFGRFRWTTLDPDRLPVALEHLVPHYRATVRTDPPAVLETPRMWMPGYRARVDGVPSSLERSREGLVAVAVPAGTHVVEVFYRGPWVLHAAFWTSVLGWIAVAGLAVRPARWRRDPPA